MRTSQIQRIKRHTEAVYNYLLLARRIMRPTHEHRKAALYLADVMTPELHSRRETRSL